MTLDRPPAERPPLPGGPYLVCGMARSGQAVAASLARVGETVVAVDSSSPKDAEGLRVDGVEVHLDASGEDHLEGIRTLVKSPGVPQDAPVVVAARRAGIPVVGELEIGWRMTSGPIIAVTGTNGKTTTVEMIGHILRGAGVECAVVGNVGRPLSSLAGSPQEAATLVVESSSFQLEDSSLFAPETAVLLGITPDHLDRHGTFEAYRAAKLKIFANQREEDVAIVPKDFELPGKARATRIRFGEPDSGIGIAGERIVWRGEPLMETGDLRLPGSHNLDNAQAAAAACLVHGVEPEVVAAAIRTFPGVPHRLERVLDLAGVTWLNDSKATNVAATMTALAAVEPPVRLILGGQGKEQDFSPLAKPLADRCSAVHVIGEAADEIATAVQGSGVEIIRSGDLESAVLEARSHARAGETVLLSPACASFDQFEDFEHRGRVFKALVTGEHRP